MSLKRCFPWRKLALAAPAVAVSLLDFAVTLSGQPAAYWTDSAHHNEANPVSALLLGYGPAWYLLSKLLYLAIIVAAIVILPRVFSLLAAVALVIGHGFGLLTWLLYDSQMNFIWVYLFFPAIAATVVWQAWYYFHKIACPPVAGAGLGNGS